MKTTCFGNAPLQGKATKKLGMVILDGVITTKKISDKAITTSKIENNSVTLEKLSSEVLKKIETSGGGVTSYLSYDEVSIPASELLIKDNFSSNQKGTMVIPFTYSPLYAKAEASCDCTSSDSGITVSEVVDKGNGQGEIILKVNSLPATGSASYTCSLYNTKTKVEFTVLLTEIGYPLTESLFNPIYRINSEWYDKDYQNQGIIEGNLNPSKKYNLLEKNEDGKGLKVVSAKTQSVMMVDVTTIPLTTDNYKEGMTYLNYCKMGSVPTNDVQFYADTSMQSADDNRYHVLVWEKNTNIARIDWKIEGEWDGTSYKDTNGNDIILSEKDLNKAFLVTADCANKLFTLYTFDGIITTKRGTAQLPDTWEWQEDYVNSSTKRRQMGIGAAIFGGDYEDSIYYEGMIWNKVLTEEEVNKVFEQLKYYFA